LFILQEGPVSGPVFLFAHGAGAPMDSEFMQTVSGALAVRGIHVVRFEFPYMAQRRDSGTKRPPDKIPALLAAFRDVLHQYPSAVIGGKSMGGRVATLLAAEQAVTACAAIGYPFYAKGKADKPRIAHLPAVQCPLLIFQGERDPLGDAQWVAQQSSLNSLSMDWFADGDHDLKPRKSSGYTQQAHLERLADKLAHFIFQHSVSV
jgi:uncharacterized protein